MARKRKEGYVDNTPIREAFMKSGISSYELAAYMGWTKDKEGKPDPTRVERVLGLRPYKTGRGKLSTNVSMSEKNALQIIEALHYDPVDFREIGL